MLLTAEKARLDLLRVRELDVHNMNIRASNYKDGRLVDFDSAITLTFRSTSNLLGEQNKTRPMV
jgi:hypothetical protein